MSCIRAHSAVGTLSRSNLLHTHIHVSHIHNNAVSLKMISLLFQIRQEAKWYTPVLYACGSIIHTRTSHFFISSRNMSLYISIPDLDTAYAPVCSIAMRPARRTTLSKWAGISRIISTEYECTKIWYKRKNRVNWGKVNYGVKWTIF